MSQYIKKTDALRIVDLHYGPCSGYNEIKKLPAEDIIPVVHGRWTRVTAGYYECSSCKSHVAVFSGHMTYCPNCGARMDGE